MGIKTGDKDLVGKKFKIKKSGGMKTGGKKTLRGKVLIESTCHGRMYHTGFYCLLRGQNIFTYFVHDSSALLELVLLLEFPLTSPENHRNLH